MTRSWISLRTPTAVAAVGVGLLALSLSLGGDRPAVSSSTTELADDGQPTQRETSQQAEAEETEMKTASDDGVETGPRVGQRAPDFELSTIAGDQFRLSEQRGRPVLINAWATYCPFCKHEMPMLNSLDGTYDDLLVVGLNVGEAKPTVRAFAERVGADYPLAIDRTGEVATTYRVASLPATFLIDARGIVVWKREGSVERSKLERQIETKTSADSHEASDAQPSTEKEANDSS